MQNIYCFNHATYRGLESPVLSCKTCCSIFVSKIKSDVKNLGHKKVEETALPGQALAANPNAVKGRNFETWFAEKKAAAELSLQKGQK